MRHVKVQGQPRAVRARTAQGQGQVLEDVGPQAVPKWPSWPAKAGDQPRQRKHGRAPPQQLRRNIGFVGQQFASQSQGEGHGPCEPADPPKVPSFHRPASAGSGARWRALPAVDAEHLPVKEPPAQLLVT